MNTTRWLGGLTAAIALLAAGCGGGGGGIGGTGIEAGTMRISLTDAPACGYDEVNVTVQKVRVNRSPTAADDAGGWYEIVLNPARRIDLLTLTNGTLDELGQVELPAGRYEQIRLVLAPDDGSTPPPNSVVLSGSGDEVALTTPSGQQSGLKANLQGTVEVPAGQVLDVVLDFDACKSIVRRGNSGQYNLKPVITAIPVLSDAGLRVEGYVAPALVGAATAVSVQASGVPVKATVPDATGRFVLRPVPAGSYDLVLTAPGYASVVMTGVPVVSGTPTTVSTQPFPLAPALAASAPVAVSGTVSPASATVRVLQTLTGGPTVEIGALPVDADTGAFAASLGVAAPQRTAYPPPANAPIVLTADAVAAGQYAVEATSARVVKTTAVNAATSPVPPLTFVFP